jgi:hypothetical protein
MAEARQTCRNFDRPLSRSESEWLADHVENAEYFLEKAAQCRRLAASIADDKAIEALLKLAEELEA